MCYTGKGRFENHMGDCNVYGYIKFKEVIGVPRCTVCMGYPFDISEYPKDIELYLDNELDELASKAYKLGLVKNY